MAISEETENLSRREVRYRLYRIFNDAPVEGSDELKAHIEKQDDFDGWHQFTKTWDVGPEGEHFTVVKREKSLVEEWATVVEEMATEWPIETGEPARGTEVEIELDEE